MLASTKLVELVTQYLPENVMPDRSGGPGRHAGWGVSVVLWCAVVNVVVHVVYCPVCSVQCCGHWAAVLCSAHSEHACTLPLVHYSAVLSVSTTCLFCADGVAVEGEALVQPSVHKDNERKNVVLAAYRRLMNWRALRSVRARIDRTRGEVVAKSIRRPKVGVQHRKKLAAARGADSSAPEEEACLTEDEEEYWEDTALEAVEAPLDEPPVSGTWTVRGTHDNRAQTECGDRGKSIRQQEKTNSAGVSPTPSLAHGKATADVSEDDAFAGARLPAKRVGQTVDLEGGGARKKKQTARAVGERTTPQRQCDDSENDT